MKLTHDELVAALRHTLLQCETALQHARSRYSQAASNFYNEPGAVNRQSMEYATNALYYADNAYQVAYVQYQEVYNGLDV
jgi:hypothetical protein